MAKLDVECGYAAVFCIGINVLRVNGCLWFDSLPRTILEQNLAVYRQHRNIMTNQEQFLAAIESGEYIKAAILALEFSDSCGSKRRAWEWAYDAINAARDGGIDISAALGNGSFPNVQAAKELLQK